MTSFFCYFFNCIYQTLDISRNFLHIIKRDMHFFLISLRYFYSNFMSWHTTWLQLFVIWSVLIQNVNAINFRNFSKLNHFACKSWNVLLWINRKKKIYFSVNIFDMMLNAIDNDFLFNFELETSIGKWIEYRILLKIEIAKTLQTINVKCYF